MEHRQICVRIGSRVHHIQIFLQRRIDGHHGAVFLVGNEVPLLRKQHHHRLIAVKHFYHQALCGVILFRLGIRGLQSERVRPNLHGVAHLHAFLYVAIERRPGQADEHEHHTHVNDVAAVAAGVAHGQVNGAGRKRRSRARANYFRAAVEFQQNRRRYEKA